MIWCHTYDAHRFTLMLQLLMSHYNAAHKTIQQPATGFDRATI
jgi:hypothetical protein